MFGEDRRGELDLEALEEARRQGKKVVLVMGSFDSLHLGHMRYLKMAREFGDYLIVGVDSDEKIRKRKGSNRPLIPQGERMATLLELGASKVGTYEPGKNIVDDIVLKHSDDEKWKLIKNVEPDVLVTIAETYNLNEQAELLKFCKSIVVLSRQAETSTSNRLRKFMIANMAEKVPDYVEKQEKAVSDTINRLGLNEMDGEQFKGMAEHLHKSTDWVCPVVAAAQVGNKWYYGVNQSDTTLSKAGIMISGTDKRTELYYATTTHAEINLLKSIVDKGTTDTIYVSLFPCDKCMKVLIAFGIKKIYYFEDHPEKNWSKRSHQMAEENGIETICLLDEKKNENESDEKVDLTGFRFIYPPNARNQEQLDIMVNRERAGEDPLDPMYIGQDILFKSDYWYVTMNKFPHKGAAEQFLIVPKDPVYSIEEMTEDIWSDLGATILSLKEQYNINGGGICIRFGDPALSGASLKRIHAHLIKPLPNGEYRFKIGGREQLIKGLKIKPEQKS